MKISLKKQNSIIQIPLSVFLKSGSTNSVICLADYMEFTTRRTGTTIV